MKILRNIYAVSSLEEANFSLMKGNRVSIDYKHVSKIQAAMENGEEVEPIIVDESTKSVIEGQHRFIAATNIWKKGLKYDLPVDFRYFDNPLITALTYNNNRRSWTLDDYVYAYGESGNKSYILLDQFVDEHTYLRCANRKQYSLAINLLFGKNGTKDIKEGKLNLTYEDLDRGNTQYVKAMQIAEAIGLDKGGLKFMSRNIVLSWFKLEDQILESYSFIEALQIIKNKFVLPFDDSFDSWREAFLLAFK